MLFIYYRKNLGQVIITAEEIRQWKDLSMVAYEAAVWDRLGRHSCPSTDRRVVLSSLLFVVFFFFKCLHSYGERLLFVGNLTFFCFSDFVVEFY